MKIFGPILACLLLLASPVLAGEKEFIAWWKNGGAEAASEGKAGKAAKVFSRKVEFAFNELPEEKTRPIKKPVAVTKDIEGVFILFSQKDRGLLLATPANTMKSRTTIDEQYYEEMKRCSGDKSWLVLMPQNQWSPIDLNPYCAESYGEDEITFILYWVDGSNRPFVEVVTNSPSCVPHALYGWDRKSGAYVLKENVCRE